MAEAGIALALVSMAVAAAARGAAVLRLRGSWGTVAVGARCAALLALAGTLGLAVAAADGWPPVGSALAALGLGLVILVVYMGFVWRTKADVATPVLDLVVLALTVVALVPESSGGTQGGCALCGPAYQIQVALLLFGMAGATIAGSTGLMLGLRSASSGPAPRLQWPRWVDLHSLLRHGLAVAALGLGAGLLVGAWWSGQTLGTLAGARFRTDWAVVAWLVTAMGLLARRTGRRWGRWTAGLAVVAAGAALFGLAAVL